LEVNGLSNPMFEKLQEKIKKLREENQVLEDRLLSFLSRYKIYMTGLDSTATLKQMIENMIREVQKELWVMTRYMDLDFAQLIIDAAERINGSVIVITLERHQISDEIGKKAYDMLDTSRFLSPAMNPNVNGTIIIKDAFNIAICTSNLIGSELLKSHSIAWKVEDDTIVARFKKYLNELLPSFMRK